MSSNNKLSRTIALRINGRRIVSFYSSGESHAFVRAINVELYSDIDMCSVLIGLLFEEKLLYFGMDASTRILQSMFLKVWSWLMFGSFKIGEIWYKHSANQLNSTFNHKPKSWLPSWIEATLPHCIMGKYEELVSNNTITNSLRL